MRTKMKAHSALHAVIALLSSFVLLTPALAQKAGDAVVARTASPSLTHSISQKGDIPRPLAAAIEQ